MSTPSVPRPSPSEIGHVLEERARRKTGLIPVDLIVNQVLRVTQGGDTRVRIAAMDAILRRIRQLRHDDLRIQTSPPGREVLGRYTTKRKGRGGSRPYTTMLHRLNPLDADCDCPDYLKNSLGICKHILAILEHVFEKPGRLDRARAHPASEARLRWDSIRPLVGAGDWLERVFITEEDPSRPPWTNLRPHFEEREGILWLKAPPREDPAARADLVDMLRGALGKGDGVPTEPSLAARLEQESTITELALDNQACVRDLDALLADFGRKLYPYQRQGVTKALETGRLILADDMGLGKTTQACAFVHALVRAQRIRKGLVIVPASLRSQWMREWAACTDTPAEVAEGVGEERRARYRTRAEGFHILSYEQVLRDLDALRAMAPDVVILDEAQRIRNFATRTAQTIKSLTPRYRLVLTGTPLQNRLEELASLLDWVDEDALAPKWRLPAWHLEHEGNATGPGIRGARNLDTLRTRLSGCLLRRVRTEVLEQLPARSDIVVPVALTPTQRDRHAELDPLIAALARRAERRPLTPEEHLKLMRLLLAQRVICNGLAQADFRDVWPDLEGIRSPERHLPALDSPKLAAFRELLRSLVIDQGRKLVVFSEWRRMLRLAHWAVQDILAEARLRAVFFTGAESQRLRTQGVVELHDDPATRIMFLTDAGGVGLNLQRAAFSCVNLELPWNPAVLEQRIGRIYRLGQEEPVEAYRLVAEEGIEARVARIVAKKQQLFTGLFDGDADAIRFADAASLAQQLGISEPGGQPEMDTEEDPDPLEDGGHIDVAVGDEVVETTPSPVSMRDAEPSPRPDASEHGGSSASRPEVGPEVPPRPPEVAETSTTPSPVRELFQGIRVKAREDGSMTIEAEPEAAATLAAMFEGMATLLKSST